MIDAEVLESTPRALPIGYCTTSGCACVHPTFPRGSLWGHVTLRSRHIQQPECNPCCIQLKKNEKKEYGKKVREKILRGKKVREGKIKKKYGKIVRKKKYEKKKYGEKILEKSTKKKGAGNPVAHPRVKHYQHFVLLLRKKCGNALPVANFRSKGPTRADIAQLTATHAYNIHPNRSSSGQGRSLLIAPPQMWLENLLYTTCITFMQIKTINVLWPLGCFRCFVLVIVSVTHFPFPFFILFDSMNLNCHRNCLFIKNLSCPMIIWVPYLKRGYLFRSVWMPLLIFYTS